MKIKFQLNQLSAVSDDVKKNINKNIVLISGEMGAGKTTLIKEILKSMNVIDNVSSPTFSIVNEYKVADDFVYHFDFYRIKNHYEALDIGVEDYFCSGYWNFIEWPEKIKILLPKDVTVVNLRIDNEQQRTIECFESEIS